MPHDAALFKATKTKNRQIIFILKTVFKVKEKIGKNMRYYNNCYAIGRKSDKYTVVFMLPVSCST